MSLRAITSLDAWLAGAEAVLTEQREHALSPSLGVLGGCERQECTITLADLSEGLEGVLSALCSRPGRWILIVEYSAHPDLFWGVGLRGRLPLHRGGVEHLPRWPRPVDD